MSQPLVDKQFVITRSENQSSTLKEQLEALGAAVIELPLIRTVVHENPKLLEEILDEIGSYDWVFFTSMNGVRYFFELFFKKFNDIRSIGGIKIACVGKATAREVENFRLVVDFIPSTSTGNDLGKELIKEHSLDSLKVLVVKGNLIDDNLNKILEKEGSAIVDDLQVYETQFVEIDSKHSSIKKFKKEGADGIIFSSASAADSFEKQKSNLKLEKSAKKPLVISMGPKTSKTLKKNKMPPEIEASEHSLEGLVSEIVAYFTSKP